MDPLEGLVLSTIGYEDGGRVRPIVYRASVSEMVVPYGDPGPMHAWKSAFDAGEWGLGRMANSLTLGCDCLGEIHYFDDVFADERGQPHTRPNAICMHEEDYGILWKHVDMVSGRTEVRRSRRLVVSSIATVGNYEYGFYWYFYLDGTMQLEVKLTGIMSTMAVAAATTPATTPAWWPRAWRRPTTSTCSTSGSTWRSTGPTTPSTRSTPCPHPPATDNPWGTPSARRPRCSRPSWGPGATSTRRAAAPGGSPTAAGATALGQPTAYKLDARAPRRRCWPTRVERRPAGRVRRPQPVGDAVLARRAACRGRLPEPARGRGGAPGVDGAPTGPWSTPTSCSGTPSGSPTSRGPRTGRSCRWSTPGSRSSPSVSSTATPPSTSPRRRTGTTAMPERGAHTPQEYHPPVEEYLETMLALGEEGVPVIQARIAERLGRSAPSVSEMLDRLTEEGYVTREGRRLSLTESGRALAEKVVRKHRLAERLLVDVIGLEWHKVHREAGRWEHVISDDVEARLVELLGDPATCPHGNPIPGSRSAAPAVPTRPLAEVGCGGAGAPAAHQRGGRAEPGVVDAARRGRFHPRRRRPRGWSRPGGQRRGGGGGWLGGDPRLARPVGPPVRRRAMTLRLVADAVFTVDAEDTMWLPGAVEVEDGLITWVGDPWQVPAAAGTEVHQLGGLLMPGLVNCHGHSPMTLVRSAGDGLPLDRWLQREPSGRVRRG